MAGHRVEHHGFQCLRESMEEVCSIDMYLHAQIKIICPPSPPPCLNPGKGCGGEGGGGGGAGPAPPRRAVVAPGRAQSLPAGWWRPGGSIGPGEGGGCGLRCSASFPACPARTGAASAGGEGAAGPGLGTGGDEGGSGRLPVIRAVIPVIPAVNPQQARSGPLRRVPAEQRCGGGREAVEVAAVASAAPSLPTGAGTAGTMAAAETSPVVP